MVPPQLKRPRLQPDSGDDPLVDTPARQKVRRESSHVWHVDSGHALPPVQVRFHTIRLFT